MRKLISIFSLMLIYVSTAFGQQIDIPFFVNDGSVPSPGLEIAVGLDVTATNGIDVALGEAALPPAAPGLDVRFQVTGATSYQDYRAPGSPPAFPYTGTIQHNILLQTSDPGVVDISIQYELPTGAALRITDKIGGGVLNIGPFSGTGVAIIPASYLGVFTSAWFYMDYIDIAPAVQAPLFTIAPASLDFENVLVNSSKPLTATVGNSGNETLVISNITSSNPQFTFTPSAFPINVAPGANAIFTVTFTPTSEGLQTANLTFSHNGPGPSTSYPVQGNGSVETTDPPIVANGGDFEPIGVGNEATTTVTVENVSDDPITVGASISEAIVFSVEPGSLVIPPFETGQFTVTFSPTEAGTFTNFLTLTTSTGSFVITLTGSAFATSGLIFAQETVYRLENDFYMDVMQLKALQGGNLHSLQFRLQTNKELTDNVILTFQSITKGADISSDNWILETNIVRGDITANGASQDEIFVLLYHLTGAALPPGDYNDLFHVTYRVAQLLGVQDSIKSTIKITDAEASTIQGFPLVVTPNPTDLLTVIALKRGGNYGDVNGDGCVDILDLILVVDHIVGRDSLSGDEFARADIAPWVPGNTTPNPDGVVNVQDLSVIQNIILTRLYPDGTPVGNCGGYIPKSNGDADAIVNVYITPDGISVYLDSKVGIRGAQMEFGSLIDNVGNLAINTDLGQGYYLQAEDMLRTLMYDRLAQIYIESGVHFMADMPFTISNYNDITLDNLILVDINTQRVMSIEVNIIHQAPPLPLDYILFQNYPNPFNPSTSVKFQVPKTSDVTIKVYDMLGQEVRTLFTGEVLRGNYTVEWDGLNDAGVQMSSGSYVYRMIAGEFMQAKKMVYVK